MLQELKERFQTEYIDFCDLPSEEITLDTGDNMHLKGVFHNSYPNSKKVIILHHGYTANRYVEYQYVPIFLQEGYNILVIDMRSHGESDGVYASYGYHESNDLDLWVEWIKRRKGVDASIGLFGQSMGAATVMLYGARHPDKIRFIIEDCGYTDAREIIKYQLKQAKIPKVPFYTIIRRMAKRRFCLDIDSIIKEDELALCNVPTLFIHGKEDKLVPFVMSESLYNKKQGELDQLYLVEGADHMMSCVTNKTVYQEKIHDFLKSLQMEEVNEEKDKNRLL